MVNIHSTSNVHVFVAFYLLFIAFGVTQNVKKFPVDIDVFKRLTLSKTKLGYINTIKSIDGVTFM